MSSAWKVCSVICLLGGGGNTLNWAVCLCSHVLYSGAQSCRAKLPWEEEKTPLVNAGDLQVPLRNLCLWLIAPDEEFLCPLLVNADVGERSL